MPRRVKCRKISVIPEAKYFHPEGDKPVFGEVILTLEEFEALRLKDYLNLEQEESARRMQVSRQTFQRVLNAARYKIADSLTNSKAIRIAGGNYCLKNGYCRKRGRLLASDEYCHYPGKQNENGDENNLNKIAVCSADNTEQSIIDGRFGRCRYFMLWDEEKSEFKVISNHGGDSAHGAGTGAARELLKHGVKVLLASRVGPKAFAVLKAAGVKVYVIEGQTTVKEALRNFLNNELRELTDPNS